MLKIIQVHVTQLNTGAQKTFYIFWMMVEVYVRNKLYRMKN